VLIGIIAGYVVALIMGQVNFGNVARASYFAPPMPFKWGFEFNFAIVHRHVLHGHRVGDRNRGRHQRHHQGRGRA
jgi:xanthine/uracil permease